MKQSLTVPSDSKLIRHDRCVELSTVTDWFGTATELVLFEEKAPDDAEARTIVGEAPDGCAQVASRAPVSESWKPLTNCPPGQVNGTDGALIPPHFAALTPVSSAPLPLKLWA